MPPDARDAFFAAVAAGLCPLCNAPLGSAAPPDVAACCACRVTYGERTYEDEDGSAEPWFEPVEYERP